MNTASFNDQDVNISIKNFGVQICPYLFLFKLRDNNTIVFTDKQYCSKASIQIILNILVLVSSTIYFYVLCMISYFFIIIIIINNLIERECLVFNLSNSNWLFLFKRIAPKKHSSYFIILSVVEMMRMIYHDDIHLNLSFFTHMKQRYQHPWHQQQRSW